MGLKQRGGDAPRPRKETCGGCDDGWIPKAYRVTTWKKSGKRHTERLGWVWPLPKDYGDGDCYVKHYSAVKRCACMGEVTVSKEPQVAMPAKLRDATIGNLLEMDR
jgi:hypothetical protein